jgi:hypothetical protein
MSTTKDVRPTCVCGGVDKCVRKGLCRKCIRKRDQQLMAGVDTQFTAEEVGLGGYRPVVSPAPTIEGIAVDPIEADLRVKRLKAEVGELRGKYTKAQERIDRLESDLNVMGFLEEHTAPFVIAPAVSGGSNEACPVLVASDWHVEQRVTAGETNGLNEFNLDIASARANRFFSAGLRLIRLLNQDVAINTVVLGLLGDFITGQIHGAANAEKNLLPPTQAVVFAQNHLVSGIEFLLNNSPYRFKVVCKMGNHGRTTEKSRIGVENGHSLEYLMYLFLQSYFRNEPRVEFIIEDSFHTYVEIYGETFRFNHGHTIKSQGGVGGLFAPAYKRITKWDSARPATRTVFGHHHQYLDGGNFHCNGSLIGFDERAAGEGYGYEPPQQTLLLVDRKRGQTCKWPVFVEAGK